MVRVSLVVAVAENAVIGRAGGLPWHLPDDLKHFKAVTLGKAVLMGRRTWQSIGRALPGRRNLVLSRSAGPSKIQPTGTQGTAAAGSPRSSGEVEYVGSLEAACELLARGASDSPELCVIGGAQVYALCLPHATRIYLTCVHAVVEGDVYFPGATRAGLGLHEGWREVARSEHPADARHAYAMSFVTLER